MPRSSAKAVIWDMDGVIADTASYHFKAWRTVFQKRGVDFTEAEFRPHFGQRNDTIIKSALGDRISRDEIKVVAAEKEGTFRKLAGQNIKPLPGAIKLIRSLRERGFKIAISSSAPVENIRLVIHGLGIDDCFHGIVSGHEVTEGKPSPQGFLLAARKLGVEPENCVVVEDAIAGVAACKSAGSYCLAVTNTNPRESLQDADLVVDSLEAVTVDDLEKLINPD
ncbi:HAD family hydrolase [Chloroflexota bacterium]